MQKIIKLFTKFIVTNVSFYDIYGSKEKTNLKR